PARSQEELYARPYAARASTLALPGRVLLADRLPDLGLERRGPGLEVALGLHHDLDLAVRPLAHAARVARDKGDHHRLAMDPHPVRHLEDAVDLADAHGLDHGSDLLANVSISARPDAVKSSLRLLHPGDRVNFMADTAAPT